MISLREFEGICRYREYSHNMFITKYNAWHKTLFTETKNNSSGCY